MSSGRVHGQVTKTISPIVFIAIFAYTNNLILAVFGIVGCLLGLLIEPDLDIDHKTMSERRMSDASPLYGRIWYVVWLPYALILPHRSFLSHWPILSTTIRYLYTCVPPITLLLVTGFWHEVRDFGIMYQDELMWLFIGNCVSDLAHFIFDQL